MDNHVKMKKDVKTFEILQGHEMARVSAAAPPRLMDSSHTVLEFSLPLIQRADGAVGRCAVMLKPKLWSAEAAAVCR